MHFSFQVYENFRACISLLLMLVICLVDLARGTSYTSFTSSMLCNQKCRSIGFGVELSQSFVQSSEFGRPQLSREGFNFYICIQTDSSLSSFQPPHFIYLFLTYQAIMIGAKQRE